MCASRIGLCNVLLCRMPVVSHPVCSASLAILVLPELSRVPGLWLILTTCMAGWLRDNIISQGRVDNTCPGQCREEGRSFWSLHTPKPYDNSFAFSFKGLLRVPWTSRRSNLSILKEISPEYSLEGLMLKLKLQYFGHLIWRTDSLEKTLMMEKIEGGGKVMTEDEMVGWHHQLDGHEFEQASGAGDEQGSLVCCSPWGHKELNMTERLNWPDLKSIPCEKEWEENIKGQLLERVQWKRGRGLSRQGDMMYCTGKREWVTWPEIEVLRYGYASSRERQGKGC